MKTLKQKHKQLIKIIGESETKRLLHNWYTRVIRRERKRKKVPDTREFNSKVFKIIDHLNNCTGLSYSPRSKNTRALIKARFNEKFTVDDFKKVNSIKTKQWLEDDEKRKYLRPSTLYRASKFEGYLQEWKLFKKENKKKITKAKKWYKFDHIDSLKSYHRRQNKKGEYQVPDAVEKLFERLPMARFHGNIDEVQNEFQKLKKRRKK